MDPVDLVDPVNLVETVDVHKTVDLDEVAKIANTGVDDGDDGDGDDSSASTDPFGVTPSKVQRRNKSNRAGLVSSVAVQNKFVRTTRTPDRVAASTPLYMACYREALVREIIEAAAEVGEQDTSKRLKVSDVCEGIRSDPVLHRQFAHVLVFHGSNHTNVCEYLKTAVQRRKDAQAKAARLEAKSALCASKVP